MTVFANEYPEMTEAAMRYLRSVYPNHVFLREYRHRTTGRGRPRTDIVVVRLDWDAVRERIQTVGPDLLENRQLYERIEEMEPLAFTEFKQMAIEESYNGDYAKSLLPEMLRDLIRKGYVEFDGRQLEAVAFPEEIIDFVYAFELKRFDHETALKQATRNLSRFADRSYVMMDGEHIRGVKNRREQFVEAGVGALALFEDDVKILVHPSTDQTDEYSRTLQDEAFLAYTAEKLDAKVPYMGAGEPEERGFFTS